MGVKVKCKMRETVDVDELIMPAHVILSYFWWHIYTKAFCLDRNVCFWQVLTKDIPSAKNEKKSEEAGGIVRIYANRRKKDEIYSIKTEKAFKIFLQTEYFR